jgi:DNA polymerase-4
MDAFFAAVEVLDDPHLAGRPLVVGGIGRRGVVASCSYEARAFGIRSAMPSGQARRLCPHATFVAGRYDRYAEVSRAIHEIFGRYTPLVEGIALDEAFLDVSGARRLFGPAPTIAARIRRDVLEEVRLACSVGVAATKFVAKLASEAAKPRAALAGTIPGSGVVVVRPGAELAFLHPLPIEALWGVGPATAVRLRRLGVTTVGQLASVPVEALESSVGRASGRHLHQLARAIDLRPVQANQAPKSVGHEETWAYDRYDPADLHLQVVRMADAVAARMRRAGVTGRTVTLKVRFGDFRTVTRSQTLATGVDSGPTLAKVGAGLLARIDPSAGVRLLGLSVSSLVPGRAVSTGAAGQAGQAVLGADPGEQMVLDLHLERDGPDAGTPAGWQAATGAVDEVRRRFGEAAVGPAALLVGSRLRLKRRGDTQWGPAPEPDGTGVGTGDGTGPRPGPET